MAKLHALKTTEEIFAAALLQDMAVPLLAKEFPQIYTRLLHDRGDGRQRLSHLENETLGWTHAEAAGMLVRQWNLPSEFAVLIEGHAGGGNAKNANDTDMQIVALSALLPSAADPTWSECAAVGPAARNNLPSHGFGDGLARTGGSGICRFRPRLADGRAAKVAHADLSRGGWRQFDAAGRPP